LADGVLILPDQPGAVPHELIAVGKEGTIYLLNRDNMGQLCSTCTTGDNQIVQELLQAEKGTGIPVYWNNTVYFTGASMPIAGYTLQNGTLVVPPVQSPQAMGGSGHAILTANGSSNAILWFTSSGTNLYALNATTLQPIYDSTQAANGRDTVPPLAHFATPVAVDGKVLLGTQNSVVVYGLLP
jgi:outer membrane protein assembly factor BamB